LTERSLSKEENAMLWKGRRGSSNVQDQRGLAKKGIVGGGIGTIILVVAIYLLGGDPTQLIQMTQLNNSEIAIPQQRTAEEEQLAQFVSVVLAETENVWSELFRREGSDYSYPKLVLYSGSVQSACGFSSAVPDRSIAPEIRKCISI